MRARVAINARGRRAARRKAMRRFPALVHPFWAAPGNPEAINPEAMADLWAKSRSMP